MRVYVATVDTRNEIMGVGATEQEAIDAACRLALDYLNYRPSEQWQRAVPECQTIEDVAEYFGVSATEIEVGTATFSNS